MNCSYVIGMSGKSCFFCMLLEKFFWN